MQGLYNGAGMGVAPFSLNHLINEKKDQHRWLPFIKSSG